MTEKKRTRRTKKQIAADKAAKIPEQVVAPVCLPSELDCPEWLGVEATKKWHEVVMLLDEMGILAKIDTTALQVFCATWERWLMAAKVIQEKGPSYESVSAREGMVIIKTRPEVKIVESCTIAMQQLFKNFGLTPAARKTMSVKQGRDKLESDPLEEKYF